MATTAKEELQTCDSSFLYKYLSMEFYFMQTTTFPLFLRPYTVR